MEGEPGGTGGELKSELRECRPADLPGVYEIEKASFPHPYDLSIFQAYQTRVSFSSFDGFLVAVDGNDIVGYVIFEYGRKGLIVSMAVHPGRRHRGIGSLLLGEALRRIERKCRGVELQVAVDNVRAQRLYREFGFSVVRRLINYYPGGEDAFQMTRD